MKRVAIICARGGSKGVPGKNTRLLAGKPLIAWTIEHALAADLFSDVIVSSDSADILAAAHAAGATMLVQRPENLATDTASVLPAVAHALDHAEQVEGQCMDSFVLLQATSPTREPKDIRGAVELFDRYRCTSVISGTVARSSPYFSIVEENPDGTIRLCKPREHNVVRRQDAPKCFDLNGSIYVINRPAFRADQRIMWPDTRLYEMSDENSVDIDTPLDFDFAELIMRRRVITQA